MTSSINSDHPPYIYNNYKLIDGKLVNAPSNASQESVIWLTTDVSNSQNTMTQQTNKRAHSPTPESSKKSKTTSKLQNSLLLLAKAAATVESYSTKFSPTSDITFISTEEETSGIPINKIDSFVYEVTHLGYMINDGIVTYSQELIKYEWGLFETIYREFKENKKNGYPLNDNKVWDKIKTDLIEEYKNRSEKLLMWNSAPYQQGTDDAQNITLKAVDRIKKELKHYLRQDLSFFLKTVADK